MQTHSSMLASASPEFYDRVLGPVHEPLTQNLVRRLSDLSTGTLLETAAGTGAVTRVLAHTLPDTVAITATDLNQSRIEYAAAQPGATRVTWRQADALALPFGDGTFDAVVCQLGVMYFPDKIAGYREALRVLKPRGRFLFNLWDRIEENDFPRTVSEVLAALFPEDPPRFLEQMAYGYHQTSTIRDELRAAGFGSIAVEAVEATGRFESAHTMAKGYCQGGACAGEIEARRPGGLEQVTNAVADAIASRLGDGPITGRMRAHVFSAVR